MGVNMKRSIAYRRLLHIAFAFLAVTAIFFAGSILQRVQAATGTQAHAQMSVEDNEQAHDLFIVDKDIVIRGSITDNLIAIDSNVTIEPGGRVDTLLAIGGHVVKRPGSYVHNAFIVDGTGLAGHLSIGIAFVSFTILLKFVGSVILIFSAVAFSVLLKPWIHRPLERMSSGVRRQFAIGFLLTVGVIAAVVGFATTGIGLPVALLIALCDVLIALIGLTVIALYAGRTIVQPYRSSPPDWMSALVGSILLVASANIPVIGIILFFVAWCTGTSGVLSSLRRRHRV